MTEWIYSRLKSMIFMKDLFPIRVGVNAVITSDNRLLAVKFDDETGPHYNLPGGGIEADERIRAGLIREVYEETTADVEVGDLVFVHEYYPPAHDTRYGSVHKLTLFFECELYGTGTPTLPETPDLNQVGVEWLPLDAIEEQPLLPDLDETWRQVAKSAPARQFLDDG